VIGVVFDPGKLTGKDQEWWTDWEKRASEATIKAIDSFEKWLAGDRKEPFQFKFNSEIWRDLKNWLMRNVFYRKCAYCERIISGSHGDAEHYRPKGAVKCRAGQSDDFVEPTCKIVHPPSKKELDLGHPGYFWLAYDWHNLVPACEFCNSGQGKNERFDIQGGDYVVLLRIDPVHGFDGVQSTTWPDYYYPSAASLDQLEQPFLLNPLNPEATRNPRQHLRFGVRGTVAALKKSPLGQACIDVFRLRDEDLRQDRQKAQTDFRYLYFDALRELDPQKPGESKGQALLNEYAAGKHPFSAAALDYHRIL